MLYICNIGYYKHFLIIKCVGLEPILFAINLDDALSSKIFHIFDYLFLSIILHTLINKFITFQKKIMRVLIKTYFT